MENRQVFYPGQRIKLIKGYDGMKKGEETRIVYLDDQDRNHVVVYYDKGWTLNLNGRTNNKRYSLDPKINKDRIIKAYTVHISCIVSLDTENYEIF